MNWELNWQVTKVVLKKIKKGKEEAKANYRPCLKDELFDLWIRIFLDPNDEQVHHLRSLDKEVRRRERLSAHLWRIKSKSTWMKIGDAPNKCFFLLVTTKRICESIKTLALVDKRLIEDKTKILEGVYAYYRKLYQKDRRVA